MNEIILASQSPRRSDLLRNMGVSFIACPSSFSENLDESKDAEYVAKELALGKAKDVAKSHADRYVLGSDTIVALNGKQMAKPADIHEAREMLLSLAGQESTVSTGIAIVHESQGIEIIDADSATVFFKPDSREVVRLREEYLSSGDWKDKAGGYGIQSGAAPLIEKIEGNYDTIVGLPTGLLATILNDLGIKAHPVHEHDSFAQLS